MNIEYEWIPYRWQNAEYGAKPTSPSPKTILSRHQQFSHSRHSLGRLMKNCRMNVRFWVSLNGGRSTKFVSDIFPSMPHTRVKSSSWEMTTWGRLWLWKCLLSDLIQRFPTYAYTGGLTRTAMKRATHLTIFRNLTIQLEHVRSHLISVSKSR